jgi:hypothetical protein
VAACETSVKHWQGVRSAYRERLSNLSPILHPWRLVDSACQTSQAVESQLRAEVQALETLLERNGLPVQKDILDKVRQQRAGVSALVDFWWQTVWQDVTQMAMTPRGITWVEEWLLPLMYWQAQLSRTRCPVQKAQIALMLQAVQEPFERHPCTRHLAPEVLAGWNRGPESMPGPSSGHPRRWQVETALSLRCSPIIAACRCVATRCGPCCTPAIVAPQMGRRQHRGFSGGRFPLSLRACYRGSTSCRCPGSAVRPSREVMEDTKCPGLNGYPSQLTAHERDASKGCPTPRTPLKGIEWQIQAHILVEDETIV